MFKINAALSDMSVHHFTFHENCP